MLWSLFAASCTYIPAILRLEEILRLNNTDTLLRLDDLDGNSSVVLYTFAALNVLQILIFLMLIHPARISKHFNPKKKRIYELSIAGISILAACFYAAGIILSIVYAKEFRLFEV